MRFTDNGIAALKPKAARYEVWSDDRSGFGLRVGTSGRKSWIYVYHFEGHPRRMTLGAYSSKMKLADARIALGKAQKLLDEGIDPGAKHVEKRRAEREAETVKQLADEYLKRHARVHKRTADADERAIEREIVPSWGRRKARDITRRDVVRLLDAVADRGSPVMRNRLGSLISRMFSFGVERGILETSPCIAIRRLPETPRERFLSPEEIHALWSGLDAAGMDPRTALAVKFALVTGQRRAEVAGIERGEIDDHQRLWRLPGGRAKTGRDNIVPLPPIAMRLVAEADKLRVKPPPAKLNRKDRKPYDPTPSPWLFPSRQGRKPLEPAALTRALNRNREALGIGDATVHDLRRTFATMHGELGTAPEILSALLNHAPATITHKVYNRALNLEPRRAAMERWGEWLELVVAGRFDAAKKLFGAEIVELRESA